MAGQVWRHCQHVAYVDSEDRVVLLDLTATTDEPRILSTSGSAIWRAVDGVRTDDAVVTRVAAEYGVEAETVEGDVQSFLAELAGLGLVER